MTLFLDVAKEFLIKNIQDIIQESSKNQKMLMDATQPTVHS